MHRKSFAFKKFYYSIAKLFHKLFHYFWLLNRSIYSLHLLQLKIIIQMVWTNYNLLISTNYIIILTIYNLVFTLITCIFNMYNQSFNCLVKTICLLNEIDKRNSLNLFSKMIYIEIRLNWVIFSKANCLCFFSFNSSFLLIFLFPMLAFA